MFDMILVDSLVNDHPWGKHFAIRRGVFWVLFWEEFECEEFVFSDDVGLDPQRCIPSADTGNENKL